MNGVKKMRDVLYFLPLNRTNILFDFIDRFTAKRFCEPDRLVVRVRSSSPMKKLDFKQIEQDLSTVFEEGSFNYINLVSSILFGLIFQIIAARILGPSDYGVFTILYAIYWLLTSVATFGLKIGATRYVSQYRQGKRFRSLLWTTLLFTTVASGALFLATLLFPNVVETVYNHPKLTALLPLIGLLVIPKSIYTVFHGVIRGLKKSFMAGFLNTTLYGALRIVLFLLLVYLLSMGVDGVIYTDLVLNILIIGIAVYYITTWLERPIFPVELDSFSSVSRDVLMGSAFFIVIGLSQKINIIADKLILGGFVSSSMVGIYAVSAKIGRSFSTLINPIKNIFYPMAADLYDSDRMEALEEITTILFRWMFLLLSFGSLGFLFYGEEVLLLLFGAEYAEGYVLLIILVAGFSIMKLLSIPGLILEMTDRQDISSYYALGFVLTNIVANLLFIYLFGLIGAAFATAVSGILKEGMKLLHTYSIYGIWPINRSLIRTTGILLITAGCYTALTFVLPAALYSMFIAYVVTGLLGLALIYGFDYRREDRMVVRLTGKYLFPS